MPASNPTTSVNSTINDLFIAFLPHGYSVFARVTAGGMVEAEDFRLGPSGDNSFDSFVQGFRHSQRRRQNAQTRSPRSGLLLLAKPDKGRKQPQRRNALLSQEGSATQLGRARGGSTANTARMRLWNPRPRDFDYVSIALPP